MNIQTDVENLKRMYEVFERLTFPQLGKHVENFPETDYTVAGFASHRRNFSDLLSPEDFPLISKELEMNVRKIVSNSETQADTDYLKTYFERMKELEAQLLKCILAEREGLKGM